MGNLVTFSKEEIFEAWDYLSPEERNELDLLLAVSPPTFLMPHQVIPIEQDWWEMTLLVGGRGVGKTVTGAFAVRDHLRTHGRKARVGIGAPTAADARDTCMEGETGLITMFPHEFPEYNRSLGEARHVHGGIVKAMGMEQPKRWNGPQWSMLWIDELALCSQDSWEMALFGLRLGKRPYVVGTTTPKNKKWVKQLAMDPTTYVPRYVNEDGSVRLPTTYDNNYLPERKVNWLRNKFGGTRLGRQELEGAFIEDIDGALWKREWFKYKRDPNNQPRFTRTVIAIDPAGSRSRQSADRNSANEEQRQNKRKSADTAISVVSLGLDGHLYVREVKADQYSPTEWAKEALRLFYEFRADKIVAERNFGGDMVENTIRNINQYDPKTNRTLDGRYLPIKTVVASKGKDVRAQPVAALYEQGKVFHTKEFGYAEDQLCSFVDADENEGADMVDSITWGVTEIAGLGLGKDYDASRQVIITPGDPRWANVQTL